MVKRWVDWFKAHRDILESDLIDGRRADARDYTAKNGTSLRFVTGCTVTAT